MIPAEPWKLERKVLDGECFNPEHPPVVLWLLPDVFSRPEVYLPQNLSNQRLLHHRHFPPHRLRDRQYPSLSLPSVEQTSCPIHWWLLPASRRVGSDVSEEVPSALSNLFGSPGFSSPFPPRCDLLPYAVRTYEQPRAVLLKRPVCLPLSRAYCYWKLPRQTFGCPFAGQGCHRRRRKQDIPTVQERWQRKVF